MSDGPAVAAPMVYEFPGLVIEVYGTPDSPYQTWDELIEAAIPAMARLLMERPRSQNTEEKTCQTES